MATFGLTSTISNTSNPQLNPFTNEYFSPPPVKLIPPSSDGDCDDDAPTGASLSRTSGSLSLPSRSYLEPPSPNTEKTVNPPPSPLRRSNSGPIHGAQDFTDSPGIPRSASEEPCTERHLAPAAHLQHHLSESDLPEGVQSGVNKRGPYARPIFILSCPENIGKAIYREKLSQLTGNDKFVLPVMHTSRPKEFHEVDGLEYWFVNKQQMKKEIQRGYFLSFEKMDIHLYGIKLLTVQTMAKQGKHCVLFGTEVEGALRLMEARLDPYIIYIKPTFCHSLQNMVKSLSVRDTQKYYAHLLQQEKAYKHVITATICADIWDDVYTQLSTIMNTFPSHAQNSNSVPGRPIILCGPLSLIRGTSLYFNSSYPDKFDDCCRTTTNIDINLVYDPGWRLKFQSVKDMQSVIEKKEYIVDERLKYFQNNSKSCLDKEFLVLPSSVKEITQQGKYCILESDEFWSVKLALVYNLDPITIMVKPLTVKAAGDWSTHQTFHSNSRKNNIHNNEMWKYFTAVIECEKPEEVTRKVSWILNEFILPNYFDASEVENPYCVEMNRTPRAVPQTVSHTPHRHPHLSNSAYLEDGPCARRHSTVSVKRETVV
ncbi:uncharacterized protein LOC102806997 [Saccoglossus kowalevskii]|uniref:Uncharacterized protein LOC102806997 n=1 Tax=Saccoglossus kowalevskii TaxID=10224 RepID=A0ABM0MMK2_SACKO|nr:PREDICTED: uncharacterized protein LOC102806997 [Saccoglossus kowalevskii]